ncbi:MAG: hypothetical protein A3B65_07940 [Acidobacteria bacterium RIFCSPHIGHO2_02_FULL_67_57]|nr:MAG: hypothetical protein A3B65_07940 [Acidobacteria bacterium RIFCSPHIGHO2_02_FULL_67_57]
MGIRGKVFAAALGAALTLLVALGAGGYERELNSRSLREAWFLGKDTTFRSQSFYKDYVKTFPLPKTGVHVARIEIITPFKEMVDRARNAPDGYNPVQAEADYKKAAPPLQVKVRLMLTPDFPGHTPYTRPIHVGPIYLRDPDFWREFEFRLEQAGEVEPVVVRGEPFYSGGEYSLLAGADVYLAYDPEKVASRPARVVVKTPDGQEVQAEFDLAKLR